MQTIDANDAALQLPVGNVRDPGDFPEDQFLTIENVPVFAEHETTTKDGRSIRFTYGELKAVADRSNRRIAESGDYAALCIGHTPSPEAKSNGAPDPDVVGFAGPYRIGRIGQPGQRQRFAILADFHVFKEDADTFRKHPRRSPELWLEDAYEEMFLDPIALLGAEAPRLDLGLLYSAQRHGIQIEKYAAVSPGPANVFVPDDDFRRYAAPTTNGDTQMLTPDDLGQIVDALEQTEWVQWVRSQMAATEHSDLGGGEVATEDPSLMAPDPMKPPIQDPMAAPTPEVPPTPPEEPPMAPEGAEPLAQETPPAAPPMAPEPPIDDERQKKQYAALDDLDMEDEEIEKYMGNRKRRKKKGRYGADAAAGEYQTAEIADGMSGSKCERDEVSGGSKPYQAEGDVDPDKDEAAKSTVEGVENVTGGDSDDDELTPRAASTYKRQGEPERYHKLQSKLRSVEDEISGLKDRLQYERAARVDAERLQTLNDLRFQGYTIDPDKEIERLCYSKMKQEAFDDQVSFIAENCQRVPMHNLPYSCDGAIFAQDRPGGDKDREKYSKVHSDEAFKICQAKAARGEVADYEEELRSLSLSNGVAK